MLQQGSVSNGLDYYEIGLERLNTYSDYRHLYDCSFEYGRCQGELDALMMVYALMDKGSIYETR